MSTIEPTTTVSFWDDDQLCGHSLIQPFLDFRGRDISELEHFKDCCYLVQLAADVCQAVVNSCVFLALGAVALVGLGIKFVAYCVSGHVARRENIFSNSSPAVEFVSQENEAGEIPQPSTHETNNPLSDYDSIFAGPHQRDSVPSSEHARAIALFDV